MKFSERSLPSVHYLRALTPVFMKIKKGIKEIKTKNDKTFEVGDTIIFEELDPIKKRNTGAWIPMLITYKNDDKVNEGVIWGMQDIKF